MAVSRWLGQVDFVVWDRLGDHLGLITLDLERVIRFFGQATFLSRLESVFEAVYLASLAFSVAHHLRANRVDVHELLTAASITFLSFTNRFIITHCGQTLVRDATQIATLVEANFILTRRLHHLRLIHDLSDLLLEQAVR